jgi:hypothetical protein
MDEKHESFNEHGKSSIINSGIAYTDAVRQELKEPLQFKFKSEEKKQEDQYYSSRGFRKGEEVDFNNVGEINQDIFNRILRQLGSDQARCFIKLMLKVRSGLTLILNRSKCPQDIKSFLDDPSVKFLGGGSSGSVKSIVSHGRLLLVKEYHNLIAAMIITSSYLVLYERVNKTNFKIDSTEVFLDIPELATEIDPIAFVIRPDRAYMIKTVIEGNTFSRKPLDLSRVTHLIKLIHKYDFCHLDISFRNILINGDKATLIDFDLMTPINSVCMLPLPTDVSSDRAISRYPIRGDDDDIGWMTIKGFNNRSCLIL